MGTNPQSGLPASFAPASSSGMGSGSGTYAGYYAAEAAGNATASPAHYMPPSLRELRAQAVHRLQIGLFGLATMLLMVGLANIVMDRARAVDGARAADANALATPTPKADPLADFGVIPSPAASSSPVAVDAKLAKIPESEAGR